MKKPRQSSRLDLAVTAASLFAPHFIASAQNIARPIDRADFADRIWIADVAKATDSPARFKSVLLDRSQGEDTYDHRRVCQDQSPCRRKVLLAGTAYLRGRGGDKNTVELVAPPTPPLHLVLLTGDEPHDGLTPGRVALFRPSEVLPVCSLELGIPAEIRTGYPYGSWSIREVRRATGGGYLAWLMAMGGDAGELWSLQRFVTLSTDCKEVRRDDYVVSAYSQPGVCERITPDQWRFFSIGAGDRITTRKPKKDCSGIKLTRLRTDGTAPR